MRHTCFAGPQKHVCQESYYPVILEPLPRLRSSGPFLACLEVQCNQLPSMFQPSRHGSVMWCYRLFARLVRRTSGNPHAIDPQTESWCSCAERCHSCVELLAEDWQMNLRGGVGRKPEDSWRRYFSRKQAQHPVIRLKQCKPQRRCFTL